MSYNPTRLGFCHLEPALQAAERPGGRVSSVCDRFPGPRGGPAFVRHPFGAGSPGRRAARRLGSFHVMVVSHAEQRPGGMCLKRRRRGAEAQRCVMTRCVEEASCHVPPLVSLAGVAWGDRHLCSPDEVSLSDLWLSSPLVGPSWTLARPLLDPCWILVYPCCITVYPCLPLFNLVYPCC